MSFGKQVEDGTIDSKVFHTEFGSFNGGGSRRNDGNPFRIKQFNSFMSFDSNADTSISDIMNGQYDKMVRTNSVIMAETGERARTLFARNDTDQYERGNNSGGVGDNSAGGDDPNLDLGLDLERQPLLPVRHEQSLFMRIWSKICSFLSLRWFDKKYYFVLKCSIAYLLASFAVYNSHISKFLGNSDSKHVVATVAVYFHPSRTFGSMHQTIIFVIISIIYSFSISLITTSLASYLYNNNHQNWSIFVKLLFVSIAQGVVSYMKQKMNHPTFNTACSLASISLISAIVKQGASNGDEIPFQRLFSLFQIVTLGSLITVLTCYFVLPVSALNNLKKNFNQSCSLMSQFLSKIENSFLHDLNMNSNDLIDELSSSLKKNSNLLDSSLNETKFELYLVGKEDEYELLSKLVKSSHLLQNQLHGLKGSAQMQWTCLHGDYHTECDDSIHNNDLSSIHSLECEFMNSETINNDNAISPKQLFDIFIYYLGPSLKSFSYTIRGVLDGMPFESTNNYPTRETSHYKNSLNLAKDLFSSKHKVAIEKLYNQNFFKIRTSLETEIDEIEIAASCGNFASILIQFSKELDNFINLLNLYANLIKPETNSVRKRTWNWLKFWKLNNLNTNDNTNTNILNLEYGLKNLNLNKSTDEEKTLQYRIWEFLSFFRKAEVQFGFRVGLGLFLMSFFAFLPATKEFFLKWRFEWAIVTYCIIMNKSLGGTTMTVNWRFLGTFLGAVLAYLVWIISDANPIILSLFGFSISIYCFNVILNWKENNAFGRFILLTFNLIVLYSYNIKRNEDLEEGDDSNLIIEDTAIHRFLCIIIGVIWALIMTVTVLPVTARSRLKKGLSIIWLRLGVIWKSNPLTIDRQDGKLIGLIDQRGVEKIMNELELLLKQTPKETRLKGKFKIDIYRKLLKSTERIIDSFQNINTMILIDTNVTKNELFVLNFTKKERFELENRIFLIFYMISSSLILGLPLPSKPASIEHSKDRILIKLSNIRKKNLLSNEDFVLLYSYILVSNSITTELNNIVVYLGELFGLVDREIFEI